MSRAPVAPANGDRVVFGASACNDHVQQMARALFDANRLAWYVTGAVDVWPTPIGRVFRKGLGALPGVDRQLARRAITEVPGAAVRARWGWDLARTIAGVAGFDARARDWCWERAERSLDACTARLLERDDVSIYLGVEFGALASLRAARRLGKTGVIAFLSAHHATRSRWVAPELSRFGHALTDAERRLHDLAAVRDARRDQELAAADVVVSGSSFTTRSLVAAGADPSRILTVPLGGAAAIDVDELPSVQPDTPKVIYAGPVALHKGVHHLLDAWSHLRPRRAELHLYGQIALPRQVMDAAAALPSVTFHGSIPRAELSRVYRDASVLVLPTLGDGFGQVVADALAHGLPAITTANAGAADRIVHGESGFVLPPADVPVLAATLDWCLRHPDRLLAMRRAALAHARQWTWAHFRRAFADGIADMTVGRRQPAVAQIA